MTLADEEKLCIRCPQRSLCKAPVPFRVQWVDGKAEPGKSPTIAVVGEAPGKEEDLRGAPFCGPSGRLLDVWLAVWGHDALITNSVRCASVGPPKPEVVKACNPWLVRELDLFQPRCVVALGRTAEAAIPQPWRQRACFQRHPAYYLRSVLSWKEDVLRTKETIGAILEANP